MDSAWSTSLLMYPKTSSRSTVRGHDRVTAPLEDMWDPLLCVCDEDEDGDTSCATKLQVPKGGTADIFVFQRGARDLWGRRRAESTDVSIYLVRTKIQLASGSTGPRLCRRWNGGVPVLCGPVSMTTLLRQSALATHSAYIHIIDSIELLSRKRERERVAI